MRNVCFIFLLLSVALWSRAQEVRSTEALKGDVHFSPTGELMLTTSGQLYDLKTGRVAQNLNYNGTDQNGEPLYFERAFSPDGRYVLYNRRVWDLRTMDTIARLPAKDNRYRLYGSLQRHWAWLRDVEVAAFSADAKRVLAGDVICELPSGRVLAELKPQVYSSGPAYLRAVGRADLSIGRTVTYMPEYNDFSDSYERLMSPSMTHFVSAKSLENNKIHFFELRNAKDRIQYDEPQNLAYAWYEFETREVGKAELNENFGPDYSSFTPDGKYMAVADNGVLRVFDVTRGKLHKKLDLGENTTARPWLSPNLEYAVAVAYSSAQVWSLNKGKLLYELEGRLLEDARSDATSDFSPIISPDNRYLINATSGAVWDLPTGKYLGLMSGIQHSVAAERATLTANNRAVIHYPDGASRVFDATTGVELYTSVTQDINSLQLVASDNGLWVAATDWNGRLQVWNGGEKAPQRSWKPFDGALVAQVWFAPDATRLYARSLNGHLIAYSLPALEPVLQLTDLPQANMWYATQEHLLGRVSNELYVLDARDGKQVNTQQFPQPYAYCQFPLHAPSHLVYANENVVNYQNAVLVHQLTVQREKSRSWDKVRFLLPKPDVPSALYTLGSSGHAFEWDLLRGQVKPVKLKKDGEKLDFDRAAFRPSLSTVVGNDDVLLYSFRNMRVYNPFAKLKDIAGYDPSTADEDYATSADASFIGITMGRGKVGKYQALCFFRASSGERISCAGLNPEEEPEECLFALNGRTAWVSAMDYTGYKKAILEVDVATGKVLKRSAGLDFQPHNLQESPDGQWVVFTDKWSRVMALDNSLQNVLLDVKTPFAAANFYVIVSPDSRYVVAMREEGYKGGDMALIDMKTKQVSHVPALGYYANFTGDSRFLFSTLKDDRVDADFLSMWSLQNKPRKLATLMQLGQTDKAVIYTPDKYYMASKDAVKELHFAAGTRTYLFDQFDLRFNRPDKVLATLGYADQNMLAAYRRAWEKRVQRMGFDPKLFDGVEAKINTPEVQLLSAIPLTTNESAIALKFEARDSLSRIERLHVYHNGVPIFGSKGLEVGSREQKASKGFALQHDYRLDLLPGKNVLEVSAINSQGIESVRERHELVCNAQPEGTPQLYVVSIGVSDFVNTEMNLTYAAKDATDLSALLQGRTANFAEVKVLNFTNAEATRANILSAKATLAQSKPHDQVVLFVASHGLLDSKLDYYIATHDVNFENPSEKGLRYEDLEDLLDGIPARHKLMLIDACHSGEVDKEESVLVEVQNPTATEGVKARGFKALKNRQGMGLSNSFELMKELFADIRRGTGAVVISSASGQEYAFESSAYKNGVFTYALLEGLKNGTANPKDPKNIRVSHLRDYVIQRVEQLTHGKQHPTSRTDNLESDFRVW